MIKVNKKLILLLALVLVIGVLSGCNEQLTAPEDVDQEFFDDMIVILGKLEKTKGKLNTDNGKKELEEYLENKLWLDYKEAEIVEAIDDLHFWVFFYNDVKEDEELSDDLSLKSKIKDVSELMGFDIEEKFKIYK
ncbi:MAG: hypothetical protein PHT02_10105 [Tissierellia bacterium]|nr:hypothetical protein [Tissierellia bacterium]